MFCNQTLQRMQEYRSINGTDALIERLFKRPDLFEVTMWVDTSPSAFRRRSKEVRAALSLLPIPCQAALHDRKASNGSGGGLSMPIVNVGYR
jgi:hypothetical protein